VNLWPRSVRTRLALSLAGVLAILLSLFSASLYVLTRKDLLEEVDARCRRDLNVIQHEVDESDDEAREIEDHGLVPLYSICKDGEQLHASTGWIGNGLPARFERRDEDEESRWESGPDKSFAIAQGSVDTSRGTFTITVAEDEGTVRASLARLRTVLLFALPATIAAAFVGGSLLARRLLAPVGSMARAADQITEERLSERLPVEDSADEFGQLANAFNRAFARIEGAFAKTRRFTSDASHELRTPLTALRIVGEGALRARLGAEGCRDAIASMLEECDRLTRLVDGLLLLSREDADAYRARFARFDLADLAQEVVGVLRVLAEERGQRIEADLPPGILVHGERTSLRQAVFNLVDNAIKYTPRGGTIRVGIRWSGDHGASIEVSDSGPGIAPEHRERIFERFYRVDEDRNRATGGSGLGLSIARWAAELHGGRIDLATEEGKGSTFALRIPQARRAPEPAVISRPA
jgi:heavy metal sensor kinase